MQREICIKINETTDTVNHRDLQRAELFKFQRSVWTRQIGDHRSSRTS